MKAAEDAAYSDDDVLILDDWYLDANGRRLEGMTSMMHWTINGASCAILVPGCSTAISSIMKTVE